MCEYQILNGEQLALLTVSPIPVKHRKNSINKQYCVKLDLENHGENNPQTASCEVFVCAFTKLYKIKRCRWFLVLPDDFM